MKLKQVLEAADRAADQVSTWPEWKRELSVEDVVEDVTQEVRKQTRDWAFVGFTKHGKTERPHPIGVYSNWRDGRAVANAWMRNTSNALRWEAMRLHEELADDSDD